MQDKEVKEDMEKQGYRFVGHHSTVKTCGWTRKALKDEGYCYKHKFYGIKSHQCMQMSTCLSCANRCVFCWRGHKEPVSEEWQGDIDDPGRILEESQKEHHQLLVGFKGNSDVNKKRFEESRNVKHIALSLTGEPIIYPRINELLTLCNEKKISTFLVTNGQYPEQIKNLDRVTQIYLSLDAPNKELLKKIDVPLFKDYWERLLKSLEYISQRKDRTCCRITLIKGMNMLEPENYAELLKKGDFDLVEVKAYMFVGASRQRLSKPNMPLHEEAVEFSKELLKFLPEYGLVSEHIPSRVVLLAKKKFFVEGKWKTWIDFENNENMIETPETGLSGEGTISHLEEGRKKDILSQRHE